MVLLRHGETEWNLQGRLQGRADSALTARGREQAHAIGAWIRSIGVILIHASPLERVKETLRITGDDMYNCSMFEEELCELDFGCYTGRRKGQLPAKFSLQMQRDRWNTPFPDGESLADLARRTAAFLSKLDTRSEKALCVLAHEMVNATIIGHLLRLEPSMIAEIRQPQGVGYIVYDRRLMVHIISSCELTDVCFVRTRHGANV